MEHKVGDKMFVDYTGKKLSIIDPAIVPANLKSAVKKSHRYEPEIADSLQDFALYHNTTILPTRAYHPKDKALVENAVKITYRRVFAPLRNK